MMKSFFKKLAFVMALAMVVSTATPAGAVFAADVKGIALQTAKSDAEILTSDNVAVGESVDYKFYGAANWRTLGLVWASSDEAVATVDQTGVVTGVADGIATINLKSADGSYDVSIKIVVGKGDQSYTYKQSSHKVATFTFQQDVNYTVDDVVLTKVFDGGYEVNWPIESFSCEKNVVAIAPYVDFQDGDTYTIKIGAEDEGTTFTTTLGTVDFIQIAWESLDQEKAFAKLTEDDEDIEVELSVKLFSNGVDVSKASGYDVSSVEFELVNENDDYDMDDNILIFEKPGAAATVRAIYTYDDAEGEEQTVENFATIISEPAPKYTIVAVDKWTIAADDVEKIDWAKDLTHSLPAFDDEDDTYSIVLLMTDSYGNKIVFPNDFAEISKLGDKDIYALSDIQDAAEDCYIEAAEDFEIRYMSTNLNKIFVGTLDGEITTIGKSSAPVIISLYDENDDDDMVLVKNMFAAAVEITEERKAASIKVSTSAKILVDPDGLVSGFDECDATFTVYDQYGDKINGEIVKVVADNSKLEKSADKTSEKTGSGDYDDGKVKVTFEGDDFIYYKENKKGELEAVVADNVKFTASLKSNSKVKTTFTMKTVTPETDKNDALEIEGLELYVSDIDQYIKKASAGTTVTGKIRLYQLSNDAQVGYQRNTVLLTKGSEFLKGDDKDGEFSIKSNQTEVGAYYAVVYDPDGKALELSTNGGLGIYEDDGKGKYKVVAATAVASEDATGTSVMTYLEEGTYTLKVYCVEKVYDGDKADKAPKVKELTETFKIENTSKAVSLKKQNYVDLPANDIDADTVEEVIFAAFDFYFGSDSLKEPGDSNIFVLDYKAKYNESSNNLFIYNVTFAVPLNNGSDKVYYEYKVDINKAVTVGDGFDYED